MSKKGKFLAAIESVFIEQKALVLDFEAIQSRLGCGRCALTGVLASNKKIFQKVSKNVWRYIKDELAPLEAICDEVGINTEEMEQFMEDGMLQYSYVRIKQQDGKYSKRQVYYMIHVLRKNAEVALAPDYLLLASDAPQILND